MAARPTLGRMLAGRYRIDAELGAGAMGMVYKGTDVSLGKPVAIKMLRPDGFSSRESLERFEREARTAGMLVHPSVAQVFHHGVEDGVPFLVMEYVDGKELSEVIVEEGPMQPSRAIAVMRQLASALEEAHQKGIVHRDIKPQNMKLMRYSPGGQIFLKVLDFGIAKQVDAQQGRLTATGAVIGTPMYMAPEQASGHSQRIDGRADLYAAGIVLYEMLTGTVPFEANSLAGVLVSHLTKPPPPLPKGVPDPLRQVVERLLKKQPEERFPDAGALDRALQACETACRDVPPLPRDSITPTGADGPRGGRTTRTVLAMAGGAVSLAAATMAIVVLFGKRPPPPQPRIDPSPPLLIADAHQKTGGPHTVAAQTIPSAAAPGAVAKGGEASPKGEAERARPRKSRGGTRSQAQAGEEPLSDAKGQPGHATEAIMKLEEAERMYKEERYSDAIQLAQQSISLKDTAAARRLITMSHCGSRNLGMAVATFHRVASAHRRQVIDYCRQRDIELE